MQINVKNIENLDQSIQILKKFSEEIEMIGNEKTNRIIKLLEIVEKELSISNNFLSIAKIKEMEKMSILIKKKGELVLAFQRESAALMSGNPIAISVASANVAKKSNEVYIANQNYQRAKTNRINMERRVEFINQAKFKNERLLEETRQIFKINIFNINFLKGQTSNRLQNAYKELREYFNYNNINNVELDDLVSLIKQNGKNRIEKNSNYSSKINKYISTVEELQVYKNENLEESKVNGRTVLKANEIDLNLKDAKGRTNLQRMEKGLAPLDMEGRPFNLHHIGQKIDSPLAELKDIVHKQNDAILHNKNIPTEVHNGDINWDRERANHWKQRAKIIQEEKEEDEYV